jgi:hypothetical protein
MADEAVGGRKDAVGAEEMDEAAKVSMIPGL